MEAITLSLADTAPELFDDIVRIEADGNGADARAFFKRLGYALDTLTMERTL